MPGSGVSSFPLWLVLTVVLGLSGPCSAQSLPDGFIDEQIVGGFIQPVGLAQLPDERVLVIDHGKLVFDGSLESLRAEAADEGIAIVDLHSEPSPEDLERVSSGLVSGKKLSLLRYEARFDRRKLSSAEFLKRCADELPVAELALPEPSIETVIRRIYKSGSDGRQKANGGSA